MKILIPIDFSTLSEKAAEYAISLSSNLDAEYVFLHCDNVPRPSYSFANKLDDILRQEAMKTADELAERVKKSTGINAPITCEFRFGTPVEAIDDYAKDNDVDLIIMGTKGESVIQNRIFGSVATGVLERVSCPTLFIPAHAEKGKPAQIAFATDLEHLTDELEELIAFAQFFNARIDVVHVYPESVSPDTFDEEKIRLQLIANCNYPDITFTAMMGKNIMEGIDRYIDYANPDMVAMVSYRSGLFEYIFETSYTEEMAMHSRVPLLVLKREKPEDQ